ncbi:MAG: Chemotaxis signal transduction protein [Thermoanaerobacterales bacterium 50_218]|nr:MAG: Chemotaxis signal transduction protein [Thermoanaerobacterales bacterium 50_218]HAA90701.1 chemotaxis protein CheW [Peptococcaceae bacterium]
MAKKLVVFELAGELYGLDIFDVREIIKDTPVTKIPRAPDFVEGVVNLRGKLIPVIDLRKRFGFEEGEKTEETRIIIVDISGQEAGLVVDAVEEVATVEEDSIEAAPEVTTVNAAFVEGLAKKVDELIIIIKLDLLLEVEEKEMLKSVSQEVAGQAS